MHKELENMKEYVVNYKNFLRTQRELLKKELFFCTECNEIHTFENRVGVKNICKPCYREMNKIRQRKLRAKRKAESTL